MARGNFVPTKKCLRHYFTSYWQFVPEQDGEELNRNALGKEAPLHRIIHSLDSRQPHLQT